MIPDPFTDPDSWDTLTIGGVSFGGTFKFDGKLLARKLDRRHAAGRDGARIRDKGYEIAEITLTLTCFEAQHWYDLEALVALLFPRGADPSRRNAHACPHPVLALAGITEVYAVSMDAPQQSMEGAGRWDVTIHLVEYRPEAQRNVSRTPRSVPEIGSNATALTGTEAAPPTPPTPPATPGPND